MGTPILVLMNLLTEWSFKNKAARESGYIHFCDWLLVDFSVVLYLVVQEFWDRCRQGGTFVQSKLSFHYMETYLI